jgi:hypothetical protein
MTDTDVQFQDEPVETPTYSNKKGSASLLVGLTSLLKSNGIAKTDRGAEYIILGMVVAAIIVGIIITIASNYHDSSPANLQLYIQQMNSAHH